MHVHLSKKVLKLVIVVLVFASYASIALFLLFEVGNIKSEFSGVKTGYDLIKQEQEAFKQNFGEDLFNEHLALMGNDAVEDELKTLESSFEEFKNTQEGSVLFNVEQTYENYQDYEAKIRRNEAVKLKTDEIRKGTEAWGELLLNQDFETLSSQITEKTKALDDDYNKYLASLPPPPSSSQGYSSTSVQTEKGTFSVRLIKLPSSQYRLKTVSANSDDCSDNCPTKSLEQYVKENGGYAGMNGSYFCPPDYSNCSGKVNSYDYALYNSNAGKWLNKDARSWNKTGLVTANGNSLRFYDESSDYDGDSVTAGISNYPSLLKNGEIVVDTGDLTSYQKDIRGARGAIGFGGENIYLAIVYGATVPESAYVMRALGAQNSLNLDGGGSTALYINGGYVVGPGRSLPNAVVLVK